VSYLVFDGKLVKNADDAVYADADVMTLTNNAMMHLFSNKKCQLSGSLVNGQWFIVSYDSANKQKHHKSHRMQ